MFSAYELSESAHVQYRIRNSWIRFYITSGKKFGFFLFIMWLIVRKANAIEYGLIDFSWLVLKSIFSLFETKINAIVWYCVVLFAWINTIFAKLRWSKEIKTHQHTHIPVHVCALEWIVLVLVFFLLYMVFELSLNAILSTVESQMNV